MNQARLTLANIVFATLTVFAGTSNLYAGQEMIVPLDNLVKRSHLIAVVQVTQVTHVDVTTGRNGLTRIYVAQAVVEQTVKPDHFPMPKDQTIAIVGSTKPRSTAVWKPIEKKRYLAFLQAEKGHYHYGLNMAFREIGDNDKVAWYEYKDDRPTNFADIPLKNALEQVKESLKSVDGNNDRPKAETAIKAGSVDQSRQGRRAGREPGPR